MCLTCGCGEAHNYHGDPRHLTINEVAKSASLDGVDLKEAAKRVRDTLKVDRKDHPDEHAHPDPVSQVAP